MIEQSGMLTRQQLCAHLQISESTVRRLELRGLPCTPVGVRSKRYDLAECKEWLRANPAALAPMPRDPAIRELAKAGQTFRESYRRARLRVMPSK